MSWCSKQDAQSHTHRAHPHTHSVEDETLTSLVQWCATARVQPPFRCHGCCERSEGKRHSHRAQSLRQQSGRCRRFCSCRSFEGNGFDVFTMSVQGMCLSLPNMSLHSEGVNSWRRQVVVEFVRAASVLLLCPEGKQPLVSLTVPRIYCVG